MILVKFETWGQLAAAVGLEMSEALHASSQPGCEQAVFKVAVREAVRKSWGAETEEEPCQP